MKVKVDIDTQTFIRFGLVALGFVAVFLLVAKASSALITLAIALFLALALNPPVAYLSKRLPGNSRVGATAIAYLLVITFIGGLLFLVIPPVVEQSGKFAQTVPALIDQATGKQPIVDDFINRYGLAEQFDEGIENAKAQATAVASNIGNSLVSAVGVVFNGAATLLFIIVLTFLMLVEGPSWLKKLWDLYQDPYKLERHRDLVKKMYRVVTGYVNGQMLVSVIAAISTLTTILILSAIFPLPANLALPLAALIFLASLIPMVGATIGAIVVSLVLLLNSVPAAIVFILYFVVYQQIENNFIAPTIQSKAVELSALSVLIAIIIGITLFGLLGAIISIPIAGCIRVLLIDYLAHARRERNEKTSSNPVTRLINKVKSA